MSRTELFKRMLPGLLPLFVFIIADEIWGTQTALIVAVVFGIAEFIYTYLKDKVVEKFILLDTVLLVAMGGISLALHDDIFFKLKPAIVEAILSVFLAISVYTPNNLLLKMTGHYLKGITLNDYAIRKMKRSIHFFFWIILLHTLVIIYAAFFLSEAAWAFISGGLFYIIFGLYFIFELIKNKRMSKEEWLPLVNEEGKITGKAPRSECHKGPGLLHPVVHLHVFNSKGELYLQKRRADKLVQPGKWDTAVGGHVSFGDSIEQGLKREASEELGMIEFEPQLFKKYKWETDIESELVFMFTCCYDGKITIDPSELTDGKFWQLLEVKSKLDSGIFTPNFVKEFSWLEKELQKP